MNFKEVNIMNEENTFTPQPTMVEPQPTMAEPQPTMAEPQPESYNFYNIPQGEMNQSSDLNNNQKVKKSKAKKVKVKKVKKPVTMGKVFASCIACVLVAV